MLEIGPSGTEEENFILHLHCIQDDQKDGRKKSERFQETPAECSNGSKASEEEHPLIE